MCWDSLMVDKWNMIGFPFPFLSHVLSPVFSKLSWFTAHGANTISPFRLCNTQSSSNLRAFTNTFLCMCLTGLLSHFQGSFLSSYFFFHCVSFHKDRSHCMTQTYMSAPSYICKERRKMTILAVTSDMIRIHECRFIFRFQKFLFLRALLSLKLSLSGREDHSGCGFPKRKKVRAHGTQCSGAFLAGGRRFWNKFMKI